MLVLAAPDARPVGLTLTDTGDVDEHAVLHVDPASIDDVLRVAAVNVDVVGVNVEEVGLGDDGVASGVIGGCGIVSVLCAVEILAEPLQGMVGDLHVKVEVPGHDLTVPPPAEEGAVCEPGLDAALMKGGQVGADEIAEDISVLGIGNLVAEKADVVMASCEAAAGLTEVLWSLGLFRFLLFFTNFESLRLFGTAAPYEEVMVGYGFGRGERERGKGQEAEECIS